MLNKRTRLYLAHALTTLAVLVAILVLIGLAMPPVRAQTAPTMSHREYVQRMDCKRLADSVSFVVGQTQAGASDVQIQSDMMLYGMRLLDDHLRDVLEQNAKAVTMNEALQVTYRNCMRGMGR